MQKGSYTVEAWTIMLIRCWVSSTIIDSCAMEAWKSSYTMGVWKGSYIVEAWTIVLICCWVSSTIIDSYTMVAWRSSYIVEVWRCCL